MSTAMNARTGRLWRRVLAAATLLVVLVIGVGVTGYAVHYSDRALPGTTVGGLPVAGMSRAQVAAAVQQRFDGASVTFRTAGGLARQERLADLGYALDVDATVDAVLAANKSWSSYVTSLVAPRDVHAVLESDRARLDEVATDLVEEAGKVGTAARVRRAQDKESFVAVPAVIGQTVVMASVRDAVEEAGRELASTTAEVQFVVAEPAVTTSAAQAVADEANAMVRHTVMVSDGSIEHAASAAQKASWVTIPTAGGVPGQPQVNAAKVQQWVDSLAEDAKQTPRDGLRNVSTTGSVLAVVTPARDGRVVSNSADVAAAVILAMTTKSDYDGKWDYRTIPASWTERRVAVGAANLAYPAAEGEKWIDVNLSRHTMTAYLGGSVVRGPVAMVNGAPETPTVVGTFHVYRKNPLMTMRGFNADGTRYETPNVPWSSFFHAGYALHGAPWRSSFGYSASHGCVNLPVDVAKWVYGWAPVGTPVVSHY